MARIRSVHPGLFTDEAFMSASMAARLMLVGIWTEAFDDGIFEWKPKTLKAKIFPCDPIDTEATLAELEGLNFIKSFVENGKRYGAVRNFCKYQRPKKPNSSGVMTDIIRVYVRQCASGSEQVPNHSDSGVEECAQMEDGGWRGKEIPPPPITAKRDAEGGLGEGELFEKVWKGFPKGKSESQPRSRKAFDELTLAEQQQFADCIGRVAAHCRGQKLSNPHSLANFIIERRFAGFATGPPTANRKYRHGKESPQGQAFEAEYKARTGRGVPWKDGFWLFETEWPAGYGNKEAAE